MPHIVMYGAQDCDDTAHTRAYLQTQQIPFEEVSIDDDPAAEQFVIVVNRGFRSTPTLVLGEGKRKVILTEPSDEELHQELANY